MNESLLDCPEKTTAFAPSAPPPDRKGIFLSFMALAFSIPALIGA